MEVSLLPYRYSPKVDRRRMCFKHDFDERISKNFRLLIDGKVVGSVDISEEDAFAYLYCVEIFKSCRGKGYGRILMQEVEKYCKKKRLHLMKLGVKWNNDKAYQLYLSVGFKQTGGDVRYDSGRFMSKWI